MRKWKIPRWVLLATTLSTMSLEISQGWHIPIQKNCKGWRTTTNRLEKILFLFNLNIHHANYRCRKVVDWKNTIYWYENNIYLFQIFHLSDFLISIVYIFQNNNFVISWGQICYSYSNVVVFLNILFKMWIVNYFTFYVTLIMAFKLEMKLSE